MILDAASFKYCVDNQSLLKQPRLSLTNCGVEGGCSLQHGFFSFHSSKGVIMLSAKGWNRLPRPVDNALLKSVG